MIVGILQRVALWIVIVQLLILVLLIIYGGTFFSTPISKESNADLIVILGGGTADRLIKGISLFKEGFADKVLMTGFPELNSELIPAYIKWRAKYVVDAGVPRSSLILDGSAKSSMEEAALVRDYLINNHIHKALIVSDPPHLRRLSYIYSSIFKSHRDLSYILISSEPVWWNPERWWKNKYSAQFLISEVIKFMYFFINNIISSKG